MSKFAKQRIPFEVEGQFLGFLPDKDGKLKYLRWQAEAEVFVGKIPKPLRSALYRTLKPGDRVQIAGSGKSICSRSGKNGCSTAWFRSGRGQGV
jgi:hypothetical protein